MILLDSSALIEYLRETQSPTDLKVQELVRSGVPVAVTDPVIMEILAGPTDEEHARRLTGLLSFFTHVQVEGLSDYEQAAAIHRVCRRGGETVRSPFDCLIAAVALREGLPVLAKDRDFEIIARHTGLQLA